MYMQINMHRIQERGIWKKKTEPLVCVITGVWYLYGGFVISHWDDQGLVFIRRVRYKSLG